MNTRPLSRLAIFALGLVVLASILTAAAAANTVPSTRLTNQSRAIDANALKPVQCAALNLASIVNCNSSPVCNGKNINELILGSPSTNKINGHAGQNCCVGAPGTTYSNCAWHP
jgi:hypothetical protein